MNGKSRVSPKFEHSPEPQNSARKDIEWTLGLLGIDLKDQKAQSDHCFSSTAFKNIVITKTAKTIFLYASVKF